MKSKKDYSKVSKGRLILRNKLLLFFVLILLFILFIFLYLCFSYPFSIIEKRDIYAKVILSDHYGIDINGTALVFGMIVPGGASSKEITMENSYNDNVKVQFLVKGDIGEFMRISENNFVLGKNESRKINFAVYAPASSKYGVYDGKIIVLIRRA